MFSRFTDPWTADGELSVDLLRRLAEQSAAIAALTVGAGHMAAHPAGAHVTPPDPVAAAAAAAADLIFSERPEYPVAGTVELPDASYPALALTDTPVVRLVPDGTTAIHGIVPAVTVTPSGETVGGLVTLVNTTGEPVTIYHESATAGDPSYGVSLPGGAAGSSVTLGADDQATIWYDVEQSLWTLVGTTAAIDRPGQTATVSTTQNNFAITPNTSSGTFTVTGGSDVSLTGLSGGTPGQTVVITNSPSSTADLVVEHQHSGSDSTNRLDVPGDIDWPIPPGSSLAVTKAADGSAWLVLTPAPPPPYSPTLTGTLDDYAIPAGTTVFSPSLSGATTLTGLDGVTGSLVILNPAGNSHDLTLSNQDGGSESANQFDFSLGATIVLAPGEGVVVAGGPDGLAEVGTSLSQVVTGGPAWVKVTKTYADFSTAGTTNDIEIYSLPAKGYLTTMVMKTSVAFGGGGIGGYNFALGVTGSLTRYHVSYDAAAAVSDGNYVGTNSGTGTMNNLPDFQSFASATSIRLQATSTMANLDQATAGSIDIWLLVSTLP